MLQKKKRTRSPTKTLRTPPTAALTASDRRVLDCVMAMKVGAPFTAQLGKVAIEGVIQRMDVETVTIKLASGRGDAYLIVETLMVDHRDGCWSISL
jgi:hypothetical protein